MSDFADARWIWASGADARPSDASPTNYYLAARRSFHLDAAPDEAVLHISADSRYILWVNGRRVGRGPNRCWPFNQQYDTHGVARYLHAGENVIAVLVHHYGVSTYSYMPGRGGLICRLVADGREVLASDRSWRVTRHTGWVRPTPRAALQMGWAEQFDAREDLLGWMGLGYDDSDWAEAAEIGPVGTEPWTEMSPREIPLLTEEPAYPARVVSARTVRPPRHVLDVNVRGYLPEGEAGGRATVLLAVVIDAPRDATARLLPYGRRVTRGASLNGRRLEMEGGPVELALHEGANLLVIGSDVTRRYAAVTVGIDAEMPIGLASPLDADGTPVAVAVLDAATDDAAVAEQGDAALACADAEALRDLPAAFEPVSADALCIAHNGLMTQHATPVEGQPRIDDRQAMCAANAEVTTVHPNPDGDTEILIDFGREVSGLVEFEVEAPEGAVLGFYGFEAFRGGEPQWTNIDAGLRYVTRQGRQRFHSAHRRGLRYLLLTVRGLTAPLRFRELRALLHSMPVPHRGGFRCSDALLNRIWEMCRYTARCCMEDTFVDCPLYEQSLWVGDARNEALISYAAFGTYEFCKRCWRLAAESMFRSPVPESRVPSGEEGILTAWAELWVLACEETYRWDDDLDFQREIYPRVSETLHNFLGMLNDDGLLEIEAWNMIDWAPMDTPGAGVVTHQNAWLVEALRRGVIMAGRLGEDEDAEAFEAAIAPLVEAINGHLWDDERQAYIDSIHADGTRSEVLSEQTQTVCYLCGAVPAERLAAVKRHVYDAPEDFVEPGSPFFAFFTFEALAKLALYEGLAERTRRWWGDMLRHGATTAWEMFGDEKTRSRCHAWSAGPVYFLQRYQLGVEPALPGFERAIIAPIPLDLDWAEGRMPTPHGEIDVAWERDERSFAIDVALPDGVRAAVILPCETQEYAEPDVEGEGVEDVVRAAGVWKVRLADGGSAEIRTERMEDA